MGSMILAVMARGWMRREPGRLLVGRPTAVAFALLQLAAVFRLGGGDAGLAAIAWHCAWLLAATQGAVSLFRPVPHPILSAARRTEGRNQPPAVTAGD